MTLYFDCYINTILTILKDIKEMFMKLENKIITQTNDLMII